MPKIQLFFLFILIATSSLAQNHGVRIVEENAPNRLNLYAYNETETDYDISIKVEGTNFRQKKESKPRMIRLPATSKVLVQTLILERNKKPIYTYELVVKDSLSRRSLRKEYELIKIPPRKPITLYILNSCVGCDSLVASLKKSPYLFTEIRLADQPEISAQLSQSLMNSRTPLDSVQSPIFNLGGVLYTEIETYEQLMAALKKE